MVQHTLSRPLTRRYVLDTNVFIAAHRNYYAPDICSGFWECLLHYHSKGLVLSIDRVRDEILSPEDLVNWVNQTPSGLFTSSEDPVVSNIYSDMQVWVNRSPRFPAAAEDEFARVADGWLAAYAKAYGAVLVTNEVFNEFVKKKVLLPNLCRQFNIEYCDTF